MRFKDAMDILAASMGLAQVTPDEAGAFSLLFDDRFEVGFSPDGDDGTVVFHSEIGDATELGDGGSRTLLELSLLGAKTGGAAFSIDPLTERVVIWKRHGEFSGQGELVKALEGFLGQVVHWTEKLANGELGMGNGKRGTGDWGDEDSRLFNISTFQRFNP